MGERSALTCLQNSFSIAKLNALGRVIEAKPPRKRSLDPHAKNSSPLPEAPPTGISPTPLRPAGTCTLNLNRLPNDNPYVSQLGKPVN